MKILERIPAGCGIPAREQVREIEDGAEIPEGAERVPEATAVQGWSVAGTLKIAAEPKPEPKKGKE